MCVFVFFFIIFGTVDCMLYGVLLGSTSMTIFHFSDCFLFLHSFYIFISFLPWMSLLMSAFDAHFLLSLASNQNFLHGLLKRFFGLFFLCFGTLLFLSRSACHRFVFSHINLSENFKHWKNSEICLHHERILPLPILYIYSIRGHELIVYSDVVWLDWLPFAIWFQLN